MKEDEIHFRHFIFVLKKAVQRAKMISAVYGDGVVAESTVRKWFARFKDVNCDAEDRMFWQTCSH